MPTMSKQGVQNARRCRSLDRLTTAPLGDRRGGKTMGVRPSIKWIVATVALLLAAYAGNAQTAPASNASAAPVVQDQAPDPAPAPSPEPTAWKIGRFSISGIIDSYYSLGFNHPSDNVSELRNFDDKANQMELNMALLTLDCSPEPVGFHLDAGAGRAFDIMGAAEKGATGMRFFEQAYVDLKPASWKGMELDFGKFDSSASAEVIQTPDNWNYSRSLLFVWCAPYYHFGLRASAPAGKHFNAGFQLVSGWNNILTGATFKTMGWTGAWTPTSKITWTNTWYSGPDENQANRGMRNLYDTVLLLAPNSRTSFYINFDYLHDSPKYTPSYQVYGLAGAAKFQLSRKLSLSSRLEWLNDKAAMATGIGQQVKEYTVTGSYALVDRLSGWLEFRNDWSNQPFFHRGGDPAAWKHQPTVLFGLIAVLRPMRHE